jgi:uncharacterized protein (UPF0210 family)
MASGTYGIVRSADVSPEDVDIFLDIEEDAKTFEDYLNTFMNVNSQYGHAIENFRIVVKPVRWYIDNETTGKRDHYADLSEMVFLEGVEDWDALVKLGAGYEVLEDEEPRELTLDELADEL